MTFSTFDVQLSKDLLASSITDLERIADQYKIENLQPNFFEALRISFKTLTPFL